MTSESPKQSCPSADVLAALIDGQPVEGDSVSIERHIGECEDCQAKLESLSGSERWVELRGFLTEDDTIEFGVPTTGSAAGLSSIVSNTSLPAIDGFEVLSEIGRGGMGVVYRARDLSLNRIVAIKMLIGGALSGPDRLARFRNEAKSIARLKHPLIVHIYSVGEYNGMPFLVLEYVEGTNLKDLCQNRKLTHREATQCVVKVADALQFAHDNGVVHRDLKPENILISAGDLTPKITDFGLARQFDLQSDTASETVLGTPSYMPPEALDGSADSVPIVSDVYGLGTLLYFLLFGVPPFQKSTTMETLSAVTNSPVEFPNTSKMSLDLRVIVLKCLEKRPADRYQSAAELSQELQRFLEHVPIHARPVSPLGRIRRWCYRRPAVTALMAMLMVVLSSSVVAIGIQTVRVTRANLASAKYEKQTQSMQSVVDLGRYVRTLAETDNAWSTNDYDRMQMHLQDCPPEFRSWEWELLKTIGRVDSFQLDASISALKQSPVDETLVIGTVSGEVNFATISKQQSNPGSIGRIRSNDSLRSVRERVQHLCFNTDGTRLIVGYVDHCAIVDLKGEHPTIVKIVGEKGLTGVGFEPDGEWFVTCSDSGNITKYNSHSGTVISTASTANKYVGLTCSAGLRLATNDWYLLECDPDSLEVVSRAKTYRTDETDAVVEAAYFSTKGREVSLYDSGNSFRVVDSTTGGRLLTLAGHSDRVLNAQYAADDHRLATCDSGGTIRLWDLEGNTLDAAPRTVCSGSVGAVEWVRDSGCIVVGQESGSVSIYPGGLELTHSLYDCADRTVDSFHDEIHRVVSDFYSDDDMLITAGYDGRLFLRNSSTLRLVREFERHPGRIRGICFLKNGQRILTACNDGKLREFSTDTGDLIFERQLYENGNCSALGCSPDRKFVVFGGGKDDHAIVWDAESRTILRHIHGFFERTIRDIAFNHDGTRFAVAGGPEVHVFDTKSGEELLRLEGHGGRSYFCEFSNDDDWIVTNANDSTTRIWNAKNGQRMALFRNMDAIGFTPDSKRLVLQPVTAAESEVRFVDVASGFVVWSCRVSSLGIENAKFSSDGASLFAICRDKKLRTWAVDLSNTQ